ncbi:hypothetical protein SY111_21040 [Ligilactobacillus agilis]|uniref:Uncharacterized protein n=1 Tax=Ligilactobacillus agilis TaxID=1601 RepID=A0A6F9XWH4_9LACO|nr:hypothetical protein [Ligilactobacillus agilis]GET09480.1 hypothetical protein SY111_21040 [Ligilactobacillus agilis]
MLKYQKVANDLAQKIEAKVYPERLPKEEELIAATGLVVIPLGLPLTF